MGIKHFVIPEGSVSPLPIASPALIFEIESFPRQVEIVDLNVFREISVYLRTSSDRSPNEAAQEIENVRLTSPSQDTSSFMGTFWEIVLHLARQIPPNHPSQRRLLDLVCACNRYPDEVWKDLLKYGSGELVSTWRSPVFPSDSTFVEGQTEPTATEIARWLNLNSFIACLMHVFENRASSSGRCEEIEFHYYATIALRSALEGFSSFTGVPRREEDRKEDGALDCDMAVAAEWIDKVVVELYLMSLDDELAGECANPLVRASGGLYLGQQGLCPRHFDYWHDRFVEFGTVMPGVSEKSRALAMESATKMEAVRRES